MTSPTSLRSLLPQVAIYGGSIMVVRLLNYLLVPFYTHVLPTPQHYGLLGELYSYVALLNILYLYGMETTYLRYAGKMEEKHFFGRLLGLLLLTSLCFSGVLYGFSQHITEALNYPAHTKTLWELLAVILFLDAIVALPFARLRLQQKAWYFATLRLASVLFNIVCNIFFLWICPQAITGQWGETLQHSIQRFYLTDHALYYILLTNLLSNALWLPALYKQWLLLRFDFRDTKKILRYGLPLMVMGFISFSIETVPKVLFRHLYSGSQSIALQKMGSYIVCVKLAAIMFFMTQAYRYAMDPFMLGNQSQRTRMQIGQATRLFLLFGLWACVSISLHLDVLAAFFLRKAAYMEALFVVPVLLCAHLCTGLYYNFGMWYKRLGKTEYGMYMAAGGLFISLSITIIGVPYWGYVAVAYGTLLAYGSMALTCYLWGQKYYPIPYYLHRLLLPCGSGLLLIALGTPVFAYTWTQHMPMGVNNLLWLAYTLLCWRTFKKEWKKTT